MLKRYSGTIGIIMALSLAGSAFAADFKVGDVGMKLGGSVRIDTGYQYTDKGDVAPGEKDSNTDFYLKNAENSRIYVGADYQNVGAYIEAGFGSDNWSTRHAYMTYKPTDNDSFLIGRTWSILSEIGPDGQRMNGDCNLGGYGDLTEDRHEQIRYTRKFSDKLSMSVAIEDNDVDTTDTTALSNAYQTKSTIPTFLMSMTAAPSDKVTLTPSFLFQRYKLDRNASTNVYKSQYVQTWAAALNTSIALDPVTLSFEVWGGENVGNYATIDPNTDDDNGYVFGSAFDYNDTTGGYDLKDTPSFGGWFQLSMQAGKGTILTGAGYQQARPKGPSAVVADEVHTWGAFVNYLYPVKGGFSIEPEIAYLDKGKATLKTAGKFADLGYDVYVGVHFQYDF